MTDTSDHAWNRPSGEAFHAMARGIDDGAAA
jgi:hypothetical protein